jgi:hypothetical protein
MQRADCATATTGTLKKMKTCQSADWQATGTKLPTAKLAVVILDIATAILIVIERRVLVFAILLLAARA